jgi:hypothetical protein
MSIDPTLTPQANLLVLEHKQYRDQDRRRTFLHRWAAAGALVAIMAAIVAIPTGRVQAVTQERDDVTVQRDNVGSVANISADNTLALCLRGDDAAKKLTQSGLCELARQLKVAAAANVPQQGAQGAAGQNGRGIAATSIVNGRFQVTYSDGVTEDKGVIKGETGAPGRGITGSAIASGHLTLVYSDGTTEDAGQVVGKDGVPGPDGKTGSEGKPGRGIASTAQVNGDLVVTYTDGTKEDVGPLPKGRDGQPPVSWIEHRADGSTTNCNRVQDFDEQAPRYECFETPAPSDSTSPTTTAGLLGTG